MMKTTFTVQLSLLMLIERLHLIGVTIISANTDGVVIKYSKDILKKVKKIHREWENVTKYILENTNYSKIIYRDVNNYIAFIIDKDGKHKKYKFKGAYEIDKDYHKNHSKRIVAIAAANYFINGKTPEETILNYFNEKSLLFAKNYGIFDFCIGWKSIKGSKLQERIINGAKVKDKKLGKVNRYYVSTNGNDLIKVLPPLEKNKITEVEKLKKKSPGQINIFDFIEDKYTIEPKNRESFIEAGWKSTLFNVYNKSKYNLNYDYYIKETYKLINNDETS